MRLSSSTEYAVLAGLIVYLAFMKPVQFLREIVATPIGTVVALSGIVYVWKFLSPVVAGLLLVVYARCASGIIVEGMENNETCKCPVGFVYDGTTKKCRNPAGKAASPTFCPCPSGYFWDVISSECKATSPETSTPVPVATSDTAAPAASTGPVTSTAPMTTPSAVQAAIAQMNTAPPATATPGVQPSTTAQESFSPY